MKCAKFTSMLIGACLLCLSSLAAGAVAATVSGTITSDAGRPLSNASIIIYPELGTELYLLPDNWPSYYPVGYSNAAGQYSFRDVPSSPSSFAFSVQFAADSSAGTYGWHKFGPLAVTAGQSLRLDVVLTRAYTGFIAGKLTDINGAPVIGASVQAGYWDVDYFNSVATATSRQDGTYWFETLPTGSYTIQVDADQSRYVQPVYLGNATQAASATYLPVTATSAYTNRNIQLPRLFNDLTVVLKRSNGAAAAGVLVRVYGRDEYYGTWGVVKSATLPANGIYRFRSLSNDRHRVGFFDTKGTDANKFYPTAATFAAAGNILTDRNRTISSSLKAIGDINFTIDRERARGAFVDANLNSYSVARADVYGNSYSVRKVNTVGRTIWTAKFTMLDFWTPVKPPLYDGKGGLFTVVLSDRYCQIRKMSLTGKSLWAYTRTPRMNVHDVRLDGSGNLLVSDSLATGYALTKLSGTTGKALWRRTYNCRPEGGLWDYDLTATDSVGNIYVTGGIYDTVSKGDILTMKYTAAGKLLWARKFGHPRMKWDDPTGIVRGKDGYIYVCGTVSAHSADSIWGMLDSVILKYSPSGALVWKRYYDSGGGDKPEDMLALNGGGVTVLMHDSTATTADKDLKLMNYSGAGVRRWTRSLSNYYCNIARDGKGNIFVSYRNKVPATYAATTNICYFAKYSAAGSLIATKGAAYVEQPMGESPGIALPPVYDARHVFWTSSQHQGKTKF